MSIVINEHSSIIMDTILNANKGVSDTNFIKNCQSLLNKEISAFEITEKLNITGKSSWF